MGSKALSNRANWQMGASVTGKRGEDGFASKIAPCLPSHYVVENKPPKIPIYSGGRGVALDTYIVNTKTNKSVLVEVKSGSNGGNAHERAYKFGMPGMQKKIRKLQPNTVSEVIYFVFSGRTFQLPKYQEEVGLLCEGVPHAIMDETFSNIDVASKEIKELLA